MLSEVSPETYSFGSGFPKLVKRKTPASDLGKDRMKAHRGRRLEHVIVCADPCTVNSPPFLESLPGLAPLPAVVELDLQQKGVYGVLALRDVEPLDIVAWVLRNFPARGV